MIKARWIWKNNYISDEYVLFRNSFVYTKGKVYIDISVCDEYIIYINDRQVAFGQYPDYSHYKIYDKIDLTDFLVKGKNELMILVWYQGKSSFTNIDFGPGIIYEVYDEKEILCYSEQGQSCGRDRSFVSGLNKIITSQLGLSYMYDTRNKRKIFDEETVETGFVPANLYLRQNKKAEFGELLIGKLINKEKSIYDLGKETCGFLKIKFKCPSGQVLHITYGEHINDGCVRDRIWDRDFSVDIIGSGETEEIIFCTRRLGCRYLQIYNCQETEIEYIAIQEISYPFLIQKYEAKGELRQKIYDTCVRTLTLCAHEHYEDCPWREQGMYIEDSRNQMLCGYYAFNNSEFQKSSILLMLRGQREDGLFDICFPSECAFTIPSFSLIFPIIIKEYTEHTKDISIAEVALPAIEKMHSYFLKRMSENGLFPTCNSKDVWNFYEWANNLDGYSKDSGRNKRYDSLINSFLSLSLQATAKIYVLVGEKSKAEHLNGLAREINKSIFNTFFDCEKKVFMNFSDSCSYSVLSNSLCVLCGACKEEFLTDVARIIAHGDDNITKNTLSMNIFRFDALLKVDFEKYSEFVLNEIDKIYGKMIESGATSFWETEKGESDFDNAGSLCHGWSAIPVYYYNILKG